MRFVFKTYVLVPGATCTFRPTETVVEATSLDEALKQLDVTHPGHHIAEHTRGLWRIEEQRQMAGTVDTAGSNPAAPEGA